jgi:hypothetical protein
MVREQFQKEQENPDEPARAFAPKALGASAAQARGRHVVSAWMTDFPHRIGIGSDTF